MASGGPALEPLVDREYPQIYYGHMISSFPIFFFFFYSSV
jgi:hypothetical protein